MKELLAKKIKTVYPNHDVQFENKTRGFDTDKDDEGNEYEFPVTVYSYVANNGEKSIPINAEFYDKGSKTLAFVDFFEMLEGCWERVETKAYDKLQNDWAKSQVA